MQIVLTCCMRLLLFAALFSFTLHVHAQDTFYVKKKTVLNIDAPDSIVSYTVEYQKPGTNIYARIHMQGPYLYVPAEIPGSSQRVLFTEIIAVDRNGRRYRQPDQYYAGGIWVPAN